MPLYMNIHEIHGATAEEVAKAHAADLETQPERIARIKGQFAITHQYQTVPTTPDATLEIPDGPHIRRGQTARQGTVKRMENRKRETGHRIAAVLPR